MNYLQHGKYTIDPVNDIIYVRAHGPFNEIAAKNYKKSLEEAIISLGIKPFFIIAIFIGEAFFIPEALAELNITIKMQGELGCDGTAFIENDETPSNFLEAQMLKMSADTGQVFKLFATEEEALAWIDVRRREFTTS
jgi:hypothetical protein